jgi:rhodanese-related sulfurtransferase
MEHSKEFIAVVDDAKSRITEVDVAEALDLIQKGATMIDVREDSEWSHHVEDAVHIGRGVLERDIIDKFPKDAELILYCGGGFRSALAADMLQKMGYTAVKSLKGGWKAWKDAGAPTEMEIPF